MKAHLIVPYFLAMALEFVYCIDGRKDWRCDRVGFHDGVELFRGVKDKTKLHKSGQFIRDTKKQQEECVKRYMESMNFLGIFSFLFVDFFQDVDVNASCNRIESWVASAIDAWENGTMPPMHLTPSQIEYWHQFRNCSGKECLKNLGITSGVVKRKEYRLMTDPERETYHRAVRQLKTDMIDGVSKYDILSLVHNPLFSPEAHGGPAFLPFHREYLKQYELALRNISANLYLPYWDSSLDQGLPDPTDSIVWTEKFFGDSTGVVMDGPFGNWTSPPDNEGTAPDIELLQRNLTLECSKWGFYCPADFEYISTINSFSNFSFCQSPIFEFEHGSVHDAVGGQMDYIPLATNDPMFWMHHAFIDYIWEDFRQNRQSEKEREAEYPDENNNCTGTHFHEPDEPMHPFNIKNIDGLRNVYTAELYEYQPRPNCTRDGNGCEPGSEYLFCDTNEWRCMSKVRLGGNCAGLGSLEACYKGVCKNGRCEKMK